MFPDDIKNLAKSVVIGAEAKGLTIAAAESCTGGLLSSALTAIAGSSAVVDRAFVTYSNKAKMEMLGVAELDIRKHGAVSERVARTMAIGALVHSDCSLSAGITGIAGPGGGENKPVGLVYIAVVRAGFEDGIVDKNIFKGNRDEIRMRAVGRALRLLAHAVSR